MEQEWKVIYENDTGGWDESFIEWWEVTDGSICFKCNSEEDANWLVKKLNPDQGETK